MLSSRSDQVMQGFVQGIVAGEAPLPSHVADPIGKQTTSSQSTLGIVEAGLKEARSLLELVSKTYHKVSILDHMNAVEPQLEFVTETKFNILFFLRFFRSSATTSRN